jgi:hypothetical protein
MKSELGHLGGLGLRCSVEFVYAYLMAIAICYSLSIPVFLDDYLEQYEKVPRQRFY